jgi:poly-gamma-glutamate synthesis protein (capsule biosynthesis protein)
MMAVNTSNEFRLAATGDAMVARELTPYEGVSRRFDNLLKYLRDTDATIINLESSVHTFDNPPADVSGTVMHTPPKVLDDLIEMGCNLVSTANNHMYDYGEGGIESTITAMNERDLSFAGIGHNLFQARQPGYEETAAGRVGLVSVTTKIKGGGSAGEQSAALQGRPGINLMNVNTEYHVPSEDINQLKSISERLGIEDIKREMKEQGDRKLIQEGWDQEEYFNFEDLKFKQVQSEEDAGIKFEVDDEEKKEIISWIKETNNTSDWVIVSVHSHKGFKGRRHTEQTPEFLIELTKEFVEAGADAVVCTGTKVLRGIEIYQGKPIFYSLGNFIDNRPSMSRFPPRMYQRWDLDDYTKPSQIYNERFWDQDGNPRDQLGNPSMWESAIPICTFNNDGMMTRCELHPISLQRKASHSQRGMPVIASGNQATKILKRLARLSKPFNTDIHITDEKAVISNS